MSRVITCKVELNPTKLEGRILKGVRLFSWGVVRHPQGDFNVTRKFVKDLAAGFERMVSTGYAPPLLKEHESTGHAYGRLTRVYSDARGALCDIELGDAAVDAYKRGELLYISPSFYEEWLDVHTGETLANVLREVSLVSVPHLKNIGSIRPTYALSEGLVRINMATKKTTKKPAANPPKTNMEGEDTTDNLDIEGEGEGIDAMLAGVLEQVAAHEERIAALEAQMMTENGENMEGEGGDDGGEDDAGTAMTSSAETIMEVARAIPTASAEQVQQIASLKTSMPLAYAAALKSGSKPGTTRRVQQPRGNSEHRPTVALDEAEKQARKELGEKATYGEISSWVVQNHPHLKAKIFGA